MQNQPPQGGQPPPLNQYQQWQVQGQFTKSYTTPAIITLVLYIFFWIPGLIANVVYLLEANKTKSITGVNPDGYGCLLALFICVCIIPAVTGGAIFAFILISSSLAAH